jgi:hypothetical protein
MWRKILNMLLELLEERLWNVLDLSTRVMDRPGNDEVMSTYHLLHRFSRAERMGV